MHYVAHPAWQRRSSAVGGGPHAAPGANMPAYADSRHARYTHECESPGDGAAVQITRQNIARPYPRHGAAAQTAEATHEHRGELGITSGYIRPALLALAEPVTVEGQTLARLLTCRTARRALGGAYRFWCRQRRAPHLDAHCGRGTTNQPTPRA